MLPFFHSFGYTATLWFPLLSGLSTVYCPNPLDSSKVGEAAGKRKATLLFATPAFLLNYARRVREKDFEHLRIVVTGAEKLPHRIAKLFDDKFGITPLEGYGATELSPIATLNIPDVELAGVKQTGTLSGTVGHPLPGVAVQVIDPDTLEPLPVGARGLLLIKGPNVMLGYLNNPAKTAEVIKDGWYNTGDIASLNKSGFITIHDRLSRFSKIAGEMIPHLAIENELKRGVESVENNLIVTAVPDVKRGEKLIVLFTDAAGNANSLQQTMTASDIPNLWKPLPSSYYKVDAIPMLGSGKVDLKGVKNLALHLVGEEGS